MFRSVARGPDGSRELSLGPAADDPEGMTQQVFVLGGAQTDFARNWTRDSAEPLRDMLAEAVTAALADADVLAADVQTAHVGNLAAELFTGQAHLGALFTTLDPAWSALPTGRHEAACASGSLAVLAATAEIEAGRYDVAVVAGVELMRNVGGRQAAEHLGSAAWIGREEFPDGLPWPTLFARIEREVDDRYGLDRAHLDRIAELKPRERRAQPAGPDPGPGPPSSPARTTPRTRASSGRCGPRTAGGSPTAPRPSCWRRGGTRRNGRGPVAAHPR
jgi:acetyl-CoA C-acetyltransferase